MIRERRSSISWARLSMAAFLAALTACASAPAAAPRTEVRLEPVRSAPADATQPLPSLSSLSGDARASNNGQRRLTELTAVNKDLGVVVRELAANFGLQYQIDPEVHGTVNTVLRNKTLSEALT